MTRALTLIEAEKSELRQANYQERVEAAISRWRGHAKGTGNHEFFILGASLANAGMGRMDIQQTLYSEFAHAHGPESQRDRRASIPDIIGRLRRAAWRPQ